MGCHALLQGIFPTQRLNLHLLHCRRILYPLSHQQISKVPLTEYRLWPVFPVAQTVKNLPATQETQVLSLDQEDPLEEGMEIHSSQYSCLENPMDTGAWQATVHGTAKNQTQLSE